MVMNIKCFSIFEEFRAVCGLGDSGLPSKYI